MNVTNIRDNAPAAQFVSVPLFAATKYLEQNFIRHHSWCFVHAMRAQQVPMHDDVETAQ